jgi:hypothetical protein
LKEDMTLKNNCPRCHAEAWLICVSPPGSYIKNYMIRCTRCFIRTDESDSVSMLVNTWDATIQKPTPTERRICDHAHVCDGYKYGCANIKWEYSPKDWPVLSETFQCDMFPDKKIHVVSMVTFDELIEENK